MPKLQIGFDESYILEVTTNSISIKAVTVYGARHAFETLLQLIRISSNKFVISQLPIKISDAPRFKWRGLM
ncbi:beta-hexosaminidase alpha chain precursor, putative, partial [Entamoeba histolytica KU27]